MAEDAPIDLCFVICPIGEHGSPERKRSDSVLDQVIKPAVAENGLRAERVDAAVDLGNITTSIIQRIMDAKAVVVDLTGRNPNVFYELGTADSFKKPAVLIAEVGTKRPFDVIVQRTHFFDSTDLNEGAAARRYVTEALRNGLAAGGSTSPVATAAVRSTLAAGDSTQPGSLI